MGYKCMNDEELLVTLQNEMLLSKARARGAEESFKNQWMRMCWKFESEFAGKRILIRWSSGNVIAVFDSIRWSSYHFRDYEGPVVFGNKILKSGRASKTVMPLCKISMVEQGFVTVCKD